MRSLRGKTALVTGAAAGIGREIALRLADEGMRVALADRNPIGLGEVAFEVRCRGIDATTVHCDMTEGDQVSALAHEALERWAGVDLLVNNAGVGHHGPTHRMAWADWERLVATNFTGHVRLTHELLPSLLARPEAHVLNVCSVLGLAGMPRVAGYCATKFAMVGFSESLRAEYGRVGLGVTALCPGFVRTALVADADREQGRQPPALLCVPVERVAKAAVRGVKRNRQRVVVDPVGRWVHGLKRLAPGVFDTLVSLGRGRRIAKKRRELAAIDADLQRALRAKLGLDEPAPPVRQRLAA